APRIPAPQLLELPGHLVADGREVVRPVLPQPCLVEGAGPLVERRRPDHAPDDSRGLARTAADVPTGEPRSRRAAVTDLAGGAAAGRGARGGRGGTSPERLRQRAMRCIDG